MYKRQTEGSAIRRIGHQRWLRNIAVALGNAPSSPQIIAALEQRKAQADIDDMVKEHIDWALARQHAGGSQANNRKTERLVRVIQKGLPRDA